MRECGTFGETQVISCTRVECREAIAGNGAGKSRGFYPVGNEILMKEISGYMALLDSHLYLSG